MKKRIIWAIFFAFIFFVGFLMVRSLLLDDKLKVEGIVTNGEIIDYKLGYRGTIAFIYSFEVKGEKKIGKTSFPELISSKSADFINKSFPVIYLQNHTDYNELLISQSSFKKFNRVFPDTLKWVKEYEK